MNHLFFLLSHNTKIIANYLKKNFHFIFYYYIIERKGGEGDEYGIFIKNMDI